MKVMFLIMIGINSLLLADFSKVGVVITDNKTGLKWQDNSTLYSTWQEAIDYCEALDLSGHTDWRLPNINELKTIVDRSKSNPAIKDGFEYVSSSNYWSSSSVKSSEYNAWIVSFDYGMVFGDNKVADFYVRCVRDGQ